MKGLLFIFVVLGCSKENRENVELGYLFQLHSAESTGIDFSNILYPSTKLNVISFEYFYNGAGVAVGDINNDGLTDIYFSGNMVSGKLYLNKGDFKFEDITISSGIEDHGKWGTGVSMVDINADGLMDLYLCFSGPYGAVQRKNMLYINNGDLTFSEKAADYGLDDDAHTTQAAFFDFDRDGDLDAYLLNNMTDRTGPNVIRPKRNQGQMINTDKLYRNDDGFFVDVSAQAGILKEGYGLGLAIGDYDQDGWPDVYVSNDYLSNDLLYHNNGDGTFTDVAPVLFKHTSYSSMGCDISDYNNDGLLDIIALDMLPPDQKRRAEMIGSINHNRFRSELENGYFPQFMRNSLQVNLGRLDQKQIPFSEIGHFAGIESTDWSWSPLFADVDNDGLKDLLITNGYPRDITNMDFVSYKANKVLKGSSFNDALLAELAQELENIDGAYLPNFAYKNKGDLTFENVSGSWGFVQNSFSHGAAVADLDNDGDLDYIVNNSYDKAFVYENTLRRLQKNNYLRIKLNHKSPNNNGFGAKITLFQQERVQYQEMYPVRGFQSSVEPIVHFGLGGDPVDSLQVQWPDGTRQTVLHPDTDQLLKMDYHPNHKPTKVPQCENGETVFYATDLVKYKHKDAYYCDFDQLPILSHGYSQKGPDISVGDVDNNGLDDFFIGGAKNEPGMLFIQKREGGFEGKKLPSGRESEDLGSTFFDADGDGDLDLYVTSGSAEYPEGSHRYQDRLYLNDGHGVFADRTDLLPSMINSTSSVAAADYDQDGDMDLFVGGYVEPEHYGISRSYVLENRSGTFVDVTDEVSPGLKRLGIIADAHWADMDDDGFPDLWICGEWLPLTLLKNEQGHHLNDATNEILLGDTVGWWNKMALADLDGDDDLDLVVGNLGLNTPYRSDREHPFSLHMSDFDQNGVQDFLISHNLQGKQVPLNFRNDFLGSLQPFKRRFQDYKSFAGSRWEDIIPNETGAQRIDINTFATSWIENIDGTYKVHPLPSEAQWAPINGILVFDFDQDGIMDILLSGNSTAQTPFVGYLDAFNGLLLCGKGNNGFVARSVQESGFYMDGEGRDLDLIETGSGKPSVLAAQNNGPLLVFSLSKATEQP
ncbi:VCBS repeat-containing protein [Pareuzebyella sediminis]|uniref:VCBS repeat-containing protein n=1 Tax=Pareuzebyella sediminis TaxID=2607998 RepID=UPI0018E159EB|nr:VCBS repeat-containing protein [Pareuzebyella sediminis]